MVHTLEKSGPHREAGPEAGVDVLGCLVAESAEGLAVLSPDGRYRFVNPAGSRLFDASPAELAGRPSAFDLAVLDGESWSVVQDGLPGAARTREIEYSGHAVSLRGEPMYTVRFRSLEQTRRQERKLAAFVRTAASIAGERRLDAVLDCLADEVRAATGMATCAVVLFDEHTHAATCAGRSGLPVDYIQRSERCRRNGVSLLTRRAYETGWTSFGHRQEILDDPLFAPMHDVVEAEDWDTYVAVPLIVRDQAIGALAGFHMAGSSPTPEDIRFLTAMSDHAAAAVDNARLLARVQSQAAREERYRLARDLHDSVTQALFSLSLHAQAAEFMVGADACADVCAELRQVRALAESALQEMRTLIMQRRPAALRADGLTAALRTQAAEVSAGTGLDIRVECRVEPEGLDEHLEEDLFRMAGEALHNVVKHAKATSAHVRLGRGADDPSALILDIVDDGIGFDWHAAGRRQFGLTTMAERVAAHGGVFTVESAADGSGTLARARIPGALTDRSWSSGTASSGTAALETARWRDE
jgi:signal transduction histidine kinase